MINPKAWLIIFTTLVFSCSSRNDSFESRLTIAVASNMQVTMEEVAERFAAQTGIAVGVSSGSSGVLSAQIRQGAPFDLFLSANMVYPHALYADGLTVGPPKVYAYGTLILWSLQNSDLSEGLKFLASDSVNNFAVANPETAPYGIAAVQALDRSALLADLQRKMVTGESVAQVNQYVSSGAVQAGLTSSSVLHASTLTEKGIHYEIAKDLYDPIEQGIVILKNGIENNPDASKLFHAYMFLPATQAILKAHGYQVLEGTE